MNTFESPSQIVSNITSLMLTEMRLSYLRISAVITGSFVTIPVSGGFSLDWVRLGLKLAGGLVFVITSCINSFCCHMKMSLVQFITRIKLFEGALLNVNHFQSNLKGERLSICISYTF